MRHVLNAAEMKAADAREIARGTASRTLMERAAKAALSVLCKHFNTERVLFLCGNGNNGGDGLAMARFFAQQGGNACVFYAGARCPDKRPDLSQMSEECARQLSLLPSGVCMQETLDFQGVSPYYIPVDCF